MRYAFLGAVFFMLAIAAALLLPPLWRGSRRGAFAVAVLLPLASVVLYAQVGTPVALDPAHRDAPATLDQAVDALALRMRMQPGSLEGWVLLGRSRKAQQRYAEALDAYTHALGLAPTDPDLMVEIAEAMTLNDPQHRIQGDALALLRQAQRNDPRNQRAIWFLGIAAYQQQRYAEAATTWEPLMTLAPESTRPALRKQIDEARAHAGLPPLPAETPAAAAPALLTVAVNITPALRAKLAPDDVLFVYARMPNGPPMPLAVKRVPARDFPLTIALADADGPMPTMRLSQQATVDVQARVSHSGDALPQSGDFEAAPSTAAVGAKHTHADHRPHSSMTQFIPPASAFHALPSPFAIKRGGALHDAHVAYETWGVLNPARDNAILILTGLSPSAHAASHSGNPEPGWWEAMIGPGKPIDTQRWFVVCANSIGSCKGSIGPASIDPATGEQYRLTFPELSIEDIANASHALAGGLGIEQLACVIGCSMGGMSALAYAALHPRSARAQINISGAVQSLPFSLAIRSLQREAIRLDPKWNEGAYTDSAYPENGMRMARKLGVITYRSSLEWSGRFGRVRLDGEQREGDDPFGLEFQVESYLEGHARRFVRQFDPNCYLYLSRSMDWFDLADHGGGDADAALRSIANRGEGLQHALVIGVETDILFPLQQQEQIADGLRAGGTDVTFAPLPSPQGHDAFLVDIARFGPVVGDFLTRLQ